MSRAKAQRPQSKKGIFLCAYCLESLRTLTYKNVGNDDFVGNINPPRLSVRLLTPNLARQQPVRDREPAVARGVRAFDRRRRLAKSVVHQHFVRVPN